MNSIKDNILAIISDLGGTVDIHDIINHPDRAASRIVDIEDTMEELVESEQLAKDDIGMYVLMD